MARGRGTARTHRPRAESEIARCRSAIDRVDDRILDLLNQRARLAQRIGRHKVRSNAAVYVPGRERRVLERVLARNGGPLPRRAVLGIFREILSASRALQGPLRVAFLGPEATFSHAAARTQFGETAVYDPVEGIAEVFHAVETGRADVGVVPVENSTEGVVAHTLDVFVESPLRICAELELRVQQCLMARPGSLRKVRRIVSHPQSLAQCRRWLATAYPGVPTEAVSSNAKAAQIAAADATVAAIAGATAAERYGLRIIADGIQDDPSNVTRFLVLATRDAPSVTGADKTSILFTVRDEIGVLQKMLHPFARHRINLCGIESRPRRGKPWEYVFFLDLRGHRLQGPVRRALADLERNCLTLKILGSYPSVVSEET